MYWPTPNEPRTYVAPDANGTATGTSGADDIYATGPGQTLIGNGGDDIFHIGTNTDARIVENDPGLSTVDTWAGSYTLPEGVDNLTAEGDYSHTLIGNAAANAITGAGGNDLIYGGKNDWLVGGGGQDTFVVRNGDAADGIFDMKPGAGGDVVRLVGTGWTSFDEVKAHMTDLPGGDSTPGAPPIQHSSQVVLPSGERLNFDHVSMDQLTADNFTFENSGVTPSPSPSPTPTPNGSGVHVRVSGDYFDGPAQFTAVVGDKSYGPFTVTASHAAGEWQDILITPDVPASSFGVTISFINDAYGGDSAHDRNMYVDYISVNGKTYEGENAMGNTANGGSNSADPNAGDMFSNGDLTFYVFQGNGGGGSPSPTPSADEPTPTPTESRNYVAPNSSGVAQGTSDADDIFASADGQTLIGGGGNDIFHIGAHGGLTISESNPGISTVDTYLAGYTLPDSVDNLTAEGDYVHALIGNSGANVITGAGGNDALDGGGGNDLLVGGGGADTFAFRNYGAYDTIADFSRADGDKIALDYSFLQLGHIDSFAELQQRIDQGEITVTTSNSELTLAFGSKPGNSDTLTIRGISDLQAGDWTFTGIGDGSPTPSPSPTPAPPPSARPTPTPAEQRSYVAAGSDGVATGSSAAEDIYASADGQTLIGGGGDDIFHVGTYNGLSIQETGSGTSAVSTWGDFALGNGIDNLGAEGGYGHRLTGNAAANVITGNTGNDTLDGGAGNDLLIGSGGSDTYRFGHSGGQDEIVNATGTGAAAGTLDFGDAIARNQLWLSESGNDLQILLMGSTDRITVKDWYASPAAQLQGLQTADGSHLDARLQNLVDAMASFTANHPGFDPTTVSQAPDDPNLQNAIAASWH